MFAAVMLHAQPAQPPLTRTISVVGEGEIKVVPDQAVFSFGIETSNEDINKARDENDRRVKDLLALTDRLGIARKDVQTDYLNVDPRYDYTGNVRTFLGYFTRRNISITLRDLTKFEQLLSESLKLGVNYVGQASFKTSQLQKVRADARLMAVKAATEKATAMAGALGARIGKPITVTEEGPIVFPMARTSMMANKVADAPDGGDGDSGDTIAPGQITVNVRVGVVFELE